jgi:hypothetical protein
MPYYPPYPYRPSYGSGYYPSNGYNRPPNYQNGFNNNTIIVNQDNNYWNRRGSDGPLSGRESGSARSPISEAKQNRPELAALNSNATNTPKRTAPGTPDSWKGQSSYAGAKAKAGGAKSGASQAGGRNPPKVQGSYAGAKPASSQAANKLDRPTARPAAKAPARPAAKTPAKPASSAQRTATADRGRAPPSAPQASKPATRPAAAPSGSAARSRSSAVSGSNRSGSADRAASNRGRQSMPGGVPAKAKSTPKTRQR